jgi:hypothetical protein
MLIEQREEGSLKRERGRHGTGLFGAEEERVRDAGASILCNDLFVYGDNREGSIDGDTKQSRWHEAESTAQITAFPMASESHEDGNSVHECIDRVSRIIKNRVGRP